MMIKKYKCVNADTGAVVAYGNDNTAVVDMILSGNYVWIQNELTEEELLIVNAEINAGIDAQIADMEAKQARPLREYLIAADDTAKAAALARVQAIDSQIAALRAQRIK